MKVKIVLLVSAVFGFALLADGQTGGVQTVIIRSDSEQRVGGVLQERGHVRIWHGTALLTADEADITDGGENGPIDIELRGNVHAHVVLDVPRK